MYFASVIRGTEANRPGKFAAISVDDVSWTTPGTEVARVENKEIHSPVFEGAPSMVGIPLSEKDIVFIRSGLIF
jgi:hypothetical protein